MAQDPQGSKPKWKVGSFLQQAVAGVESKLDLILSEEEEQKQIQQMQSKNAAAKVQGQQNGGGMALIPFRYLSHRMANGGISY